MESVQKLAAKQPLYNESQKEAYLSTCSDTVSIAVHRVFCNYAPFEFELNCDITDMPLESIQPIFSGFSGLSVRSAKSARKILMNYVDWCISQGLTNNRAVYMLDVMPPKEKVQKEMVMSPKHLKKILDECFEPAGSYTVDSLRRTLIWLAFSGFSFEEAVAVKDSDVDIYALKIKWKNSANGNTEDRPLYAQALPDFVMAISAKSIRLRNGNYQGVGVRKAGNTILRGHYCSGRLESEDVDRKSLWSQSRVALRKHGYDLNLDKIRKSGIFYRVYEKERNEGIVDFNDITKTKVEMKYFRKGKTLDELYNDVYEQNVRYTQSTLAEDYSVWKTAFDLE